MDKKLLFVCLGNICRSPAAEGVMQHYIAQAGLTERITVDSAGTYGGHAGSLPDPRMRKAAEKRGYLLTSRSRKITYSDFDRFDLIIVMDDSNYDDVYRLAPTMEAASKIRRMADFCQSVKCDHVPDPYYGGTNGCEWVLDILEDACNGLLKELKKTL